MTSESGGLGARHWHIFKASYVTLISKRKGGIGNGKEIPVDIAACVESQRDKKEA